MTIYHEAREISVRFCSTVTRHFAADFIMGIKLNFLLPALGSSNGLLLLLTVNVMQQSERETFGGLRLNIILIGWWSFSLVNP